MGSNIPYQRPDGFAEYAAKHSLKEISVWAGVTEHVARGWVRRMQPEWKAKRVDFINTRERAKAPPQRKLSRDVFFAAALTMPQNDVAKFLVIGKATVHRYMQELNDDQRQQIRDAAAARRAAKSEEVAAKSRRVQVQKRRETRREERASPHKKLKTPGKPSGKNWGFNKPTDVAPAPGGIASLAARHLQRHFTPVYHGEVLSKALRGQYIVGKMTLPEADMIALARRKGFQLETWPELAA